MEGQTSWRLSRSNSSGETGGFAAAGAWPGGGLSVLSGLLSPDLLMLDPSGETNLLEFDGSAGGILPLSLTMRGAVLLLQQTKHNE